MARKAVAEETFGAGAGSRLAARPTGATLDPPHWASRFAGPFAPLRMAAIGLRRTVGLLAVVSLGMLVAIVLICTVPLYTRLVSEVQLRQALTTHRPFDVNVEVAAPLPVVQSGLAPPVTKQSDDLAHRWLGGFTGGSTAFLEAGDRMRITQLNGVNQTSDGTTVLPGGLQASLFGFDIPHAAPHMHLFAGRLPQDTPADGIPEVLITNRLDHVNVGDTLQFQSLVYADQAVKVRVVGIWYPQDETESFWNGHSFDTFFPPPPPPAAPTIFPMVFTSNGFVSALNIKPQTRGERSIGMIVHNIYYTDPGRLSADQIGDAIANVKTFRTQIRGSLPGTSAVLVFTNLDKILADLQNQLALLGLPLYVVAAQLVGLALLFVLVMAGVLVERQQVEITTLKSRGASAPQLLTSFGLQGLLLAALSAVVAPLLAALLSLALVRTFVPSSASLLAGPFSQHYATSAAMTPAVVIPALAGAILSVAAVLVAVLRAASLDVLALRREEGRSTMVPLWQRYYLDIGLVVLCAAGYLELSQFGGLSVRAALAGDSGTSTGPDPLLVAAPGLLLLAGALLVLRVFPLAARAGAGLATRDRGASGMLAFAHVARGASAFARLTLLLTLAVGLGLFALTFQASLARNAADRAAYQAGGDELVRLTAGNYNTLALRDQYAHLPSVTAATPVYRTVASSNDQLGTNIQVLAIDPASFASVAHWRDDYADAPLATLLAGMRGHMQGTGAGDAAHPLWALVDPVFAATFHVGVGERFTLASNQGTGTISYVVGGMITRFPTMYDGQFAGFLVADMDDYFAALANPVLANTPANGPTEYWLRTTGSAAGQAGLAKALGNASLQANDTLARTELEAAFLADPLAAGMTGLLLIGAVTAAVLAVVGGIVQSALSARHRLREFAILRTLGTSTGQLLRMLLGEQLIVYVFGLIGGTLLGVVLSTATLPFLQFSDALTNPDQAGVPPYALVFNPSGTAIFYAVLVGAFVVALLLAAQMAARVGLGKTLRLGED